MDIDKIRMYSDYNIEKRKQKLDKEYREWLVEVWVFFICGGGLGFIAGILM